MSGASDGSLDVSAFRAAPPSGRRGRPVESRFLLPLGKALHVVAWARDTLRPDPHGTGDHSDTYRVSTLYFDTPGLDVIARRGSYGRAKYRIRRYGSADQVFLERKLRSRGLLVKWRSALPLADIEHLGHTRMGGPMCPAGQWFVRRLNLRGLRPICRISYERVARETVSPEGVSRLTVDTQLEVAPADALRFDDALAVPLAPDMAILELKYSTHPPAVFKQVVERFGLSSATVSKYRRAAGVLGLTAACMVDGVTDPVARGGAE